MNNILNRIKGAKLTNTERKIGQYILNNQSEVLFMTSEKLASSVGVSNASVIRFTRTIGFEGFVDFKESLQKEQKQHYKSIPSNLTIPSERLNRASNISSVEDFYYSHWDTVNKNIESIITRNSPSSFEAIVDLIINSNNKYIYASRSRAGLGEFMTLILSHCVSNVNFLGNQFMTPFDGLADGGKNDLVILLSFPRYSTLDEEVLNMSKLLNITTVLITDSVMCPFVEKSDYSLFVDVSSDTFFNSYTSAFFLLDYLCGLVSKYIGDNNRDKLELINTFITKLKNY